MLVACVVSDKCVAYRLHNGFVDLIAVHTIGFTIGDSRVLHDVAQAFRIQQVNNAMVQATVSFNAGHVWT